MKTTIKDIKLQNPEKLAIRDYIAQYALKGKTFLEFYGTGDMYRYCKRLGVNILSIDDGRSFKNHEKLKKELRGKDKMFISLKDLCTKFKKRFDVIWLDYCGPLSNAIWNDIITMPPIMEKEGVLFVTYREGRENGLPKGTMREVINKVYSNVTKKAFKKAGIKVERFFKKSYKSNPEYDTRKSKSGTRMVTIGYNWKKI
jgi:hypothetical protein